MRARTASLAAAACLAGLGCAGHEVEPCAQYDDATREAVRSAANAAMRGESSRAREFVIGALKAEPDDARAVFVLACVELEAGQLDQARHAAVRLRAMARGRREPDVLLALIERRATRPPEPWLDAYVAAWKSTGRPDLGEAPLLDSALELDWTRPLSPEEIQRGHDDFAVFLVRATQGLPPNLSIDDVRLALQRFPIEVTRRVALGELSVALGEPRSRNLPAEARESAKSLAREVLQGLVADRPDNAYYALGAHLNHTDDSEPFSDPELDALERAAHLPEYDLRLALVYDAIKDAYQRIDPAQAHARGFSGAVWATDLQFHMKLTRRAKASLGIGDAARHRRASALVRRVGESMSCGKTALEAMIGCALIETAAALIRDADGLAKAKARRDAARTALSSSNALGLDSWPIAALLREGFERNARDEMSFFRSLTEP